MKKKTFFWFYILFILLATLVVRVGKEYSGYSMEFLWFYRLAAHGEVQLAPLIFQNLFNIALFIPFGFTYPREKYGPIWAFVLSVTIEVIQSVFHIGFGDLEDVICNLLGAVLGVLLARRFRTFVRSEQAEALKLRFYLFQKRILDIILSIVLLLVLFIPFVLISLLIVLDSPGASPIYKQKRVGQNGKPFQMLKFRTMIPNAEKDLAMLSDSNEMDGPVFKFKNDPRITRVGRPLRKTGLDEFPQLINIIKGEMSLVGPRPPLESEVAHYDEEDKRRLQVKPGITCYWQIQPNRNQISFKDWVELDCKYIRERSIKTDWMILFKTVCSMIRADGE